VIYLTPEQALFIHARLVAETGGDSGVRDVGLLAAAVARPQAAFDDVDLYPDLFRKAAALMESIVLNHPFVDGNKRVGITAAALFLRLNDRHLTATNEELERFTLDVARGQSDLNSMTAWFEEHSEPVA
jgi:death-on-curing protein